MVVINFSGFGSRVVRRAMPHCFPPDSPTPFERQDTRGWRCGGSRLDALDVSDNLRRFVEEAAGVDDEKAAALLVEGDLTHAPLAELAATHAAAVDALGPPHPAAAPHGNVRQSFAKC